MKKGLFIAVEGNDGCGKTTQCEKLCERLVEAGYQVLPVVFPRYQQDSSFFVRKYLQGGYGGANDVDPYTASILFALDRFDARDQLRAALEAGQIIVTSRFVGSNLAHQGTKLNQESWDQFFQWGQTFEYQTLNIPKPDINLVLRLPPDFSAKLRDGRSKKPDIHEKGAEGLRHQELASQVFNQLCQAFPQSYLGVDCVKDNELLSIEAVFDLIWEKLQPHLPPVTNKKGGQLIGLDPQPSLLKENKGSLKITTAGHRYLKPLVTNTKQSVYAFKDGLSPVTIAAAMARLSRRGDDLRVTLLDEFVNNQDKDQDLLARVITAYGDDSVQQLVGQHIVVEDASNLLTKKLEWGRLAAYLEQSTRYIYFDQPDQEGKFKYFTPPEIKGSHRQRFVSQMNKIFRLYSDLVHKLTDYVRQENPSDKQDVAWKNATRAQACDAARTILPVATKSTVGIFASGQALESLVMRLLGDPLEEARQTGQAILDQSRQVLSVFLQRADQPERGGAQTAYQVMRHQQLTKVADLLKQQKPKTQKANAKLLDYSPLNELDLVPDMLYEYSDLSHAQLVKQVSRWSYKQKVEVFRTYVGERLNRRHKPGRAFEKIHYSWDVICDYGIFRDLQRHRMVEDLVWQKLTPYYGYDIPELITKAGLEKDFIQAFKIAEQTYEQLKKAYGDQVAQYATLLGHRMRWKISYNGREAFHLHELRTAPQGHPGYRKLVLGMHQAIAEVHPLTAQAMRFVNQAEDPELTRLAAERYTQLKLGRL